MSILSQIALVKEMLEASESSLRSAKQILSDIIGDRAGGTKTDFASLAQQVPSLAPSSSPDAGKVIEGLFDGQNMTAKDGNSYPVPSNYASKSKLVAGDVLKLTITDDGKFLYKQIKPVERTTVLGTLTKDDGKYKVLANGKLYRVLLASVTYYKGSIGDQVSLILPEGLDTEWGTIEAIIPAVASYHAPEPITESEDEAPKKVVRKKKASSDDLGDLDL